LRPTPNLEDCVCVFMSPSDKVAQLRPQGTGFPLHRLLRLAGLWRNSSNPPPHREFLWVTATKYVTTNFFRVCLSTHSQSVDICISDKGKGKVVPVIN
jgi:hypothetical protein